MASNPSQAPQTPSPKQGVFRLPSAIKNRLKRQVHISAPTPSARLISTHVPSPRSSLDCPSPYEPPLRPPASPSAAGTTSSTTSVADAKLADYKSFCDVPVIFALDVSGSTAGLILSQEIFVIRQISELLSTIPQAGCTILPWSHRARASCSLAKLEGIQAGGGTNPTVLNEDPHFNASLSQASLWCLITDGEIDDDEVLDFAMGIGNTGLHGAAAIIVLAGYCANRPAMCNISVGKSVYAITSDCLFLFHDVLHDHTYILQCKGCFASLLPKGQTGIYLDSQTTWGELPRIKYSALATIRLPERRALSLNTVALSNGKILDLNDIYDDTADESMTNHLIHNDNDLNMLLLTASTRGKATEVRAWITKKKSKYTDPIWAERSDPGDKCLNLVRQIVVAIGKGPFDGIPVLQSQLRIHREQQWEKFLHSVVLSHHKADLRSVIIQDAVLRLDVSATSRRGSPVILSPVSPVASEMRAAIHHEEDVFRDCSTLSANRPAARPTARLATQHNTNYKTERDALRRKLIYTPGYEVDGPDLCYQTRCSICGAYDIASLLLRHVTGNEETPGFPPRGSHSKNVYPMVLGTYPEADIIIPEICCDACATFLVRMGVTPKGEIVIGSLPLVPLTPFRGSRNISQWTESIGSALETRFDSGIVLQVFLSAIYTTVQELADDLKTDVGLVSVSDAMMWACSHLAANIRLPLGLVGSPDASSISGGSTEKLSDVLANHLDGLRGPGCQLLDYPLDGFVHIMRAARDLPRKVCPERRIREAVWLKFLLVILESYRDRMQEDCDSAKRSLAGRLQISHRTDFHTNGQIDANGQSDTSHNGSSGEKNIEAARCDRAGSTLPLKKGSQIFAMPLEQLQQSQLISAGDLEAFQLLDSLFPQQNPWFEYALAAYLHVICLRMEANSHVLELFDSLKSRPEYRPIFWAPDSLVCDETMNDLLLRIYESTK